jgi:hypothetical protein
MLDMMAVDYHLDGVFPHVTVSSAHMGAEKPHFGREGNWGG